MASFIPILSLHSISYRPREEIKEVRGTRDPIRMFKRRSTDCNLVTPEKLKVRVIGLSSSIRFFNVKVTIINISCLKIAIQSLKEHNT